MMTSLIDHDKENTSDIEVIVLDDIAVSKKDNDTLLYPPKKKLKQDSHQFTQSTKHEESHGILNQDSAIVIADETPNDTIQSTKLLGDKESITPKKGSPGKVLSPSIQSPITVSSLDLGTPKICKKKVLGGKESSVKKVKDRKSDGKLLFPKLSKEEALKKVEEERRLLDVKNDAKSIPNDKIVENGDGVKMEGVSTSLNNLTVQSVSTPMKTPQPAGKVDSSATKTPQSSEKKKSPISKEERQRLKDEKEKLKAARLKEIEEKRKRKEEEIEEKRKKKEEELALKQAEKEKREIERKEKERIREEEKKKREEERKIKEEEKRKKEEIFKAEKEKREAEKEKREAERIKKELERKDKEEQKKMEEEKKKQEDEALKKKKEKEANQFLSFFKKKNLESVKPPVSESDDRFIPFQIKPHMTLAPLVRKNEFDKELLDKALSNAIPELKTYLKEQAIHLEKNKKITHLSRRQARHELEQQRKLEVAKKIDSHSNSSEEKKLSTENFIIVINDNSNDTYSEENNEEDEIENKEQNLYTAKLLQFSENTRPAYYGTWRKKSSSISGRRPLAIDGDIFNYQIDSDEEWIDEPGENLSDAVDEDNEEEKEKETEDDQDGFFVPHGYLSDDEGIHDDSGEENDENAILNNGPEKNEDNKLKMKVCSFEQGFHTNVKQRKPISIGISYDFDKENMNPILKEFIKVKLFRPAKDKDDDNDMEVTTPSNSLNPSKPYVNNILPVPEEAMPFLIRFVHGQKLGMTKMVNYFQSYWSRYAAGNGLNAISTISKKQLIRKIQTIAQRIQSEEFAQVCYIVSDDVIEKYDVDKIQLTEGLPELDSVENTSISIDSEPVKTEISISKPKDEDVNIAVRVDSPMELST